jgi:hypothetical protein
VDSLEDPLGIGKYQPTFFNRSFFLPEKIFSYLRTGLKKQEGILFFIGISISYQGSEIV